ncbi:MAG: carboxylesterase family protein [Verrucomicrobiales bacterium]|nr:carboxylesterase family protein [Verrucomicrobiales bacterium]
MMASTVALALGAGSCAAVKRAGMSVLFERTGWPEERVMRDVAYGTDARQRLDFYVPEGKGWPVAVFVHGGSWNGGDKGLEVGGADVYGNIGRWLASQGIGVAVINYRLQPGTGWRGQVDDVAAAAGWVRRNAGARGGRGDRLILFGHSAGTQLAAFAVLNGEALRRAGVEREAVRGVIAVSGAGLDLVDPVTYALGHSPKYYAGVFNPEAAPGDWRREASAVTYADGGDPPFLVMYGGSEEKGMIRQSVRVDEVLRQRGVESRLVEAPGQSHGRIVLTLSRGDKVAGREAVAFIRRLTGE